MGKLDEYNSLRERSRRFYETGLAQMRMGYYDLAAFSFEQSLQLLLKSQLLRIGADYPRTHSVRALLEMLAELLEDPELSKLLSTYSLELAALEDAYITARYVAREYTKEEAERLKSTADKVSSVVLEAVSRASEKKSRDLQGAGQASEEDSEDRQEPGRVM
jgi:HEPN domain-containing protein